jgi:2-keto-4-pentenoate hydratase/2-oxohepta-3-ene-1,7-dioic acid hydratase in catechol pathway
MRCRPAAGCRKRRMTKDEPPASAPVLFQHRERTAVLWARVGVGTRTWIGTIEGDHLAVFDKEPYLDGVPTGETVPLSGARFLTPCKPTKFVALWNNFHAAAAKNGWSIPDGPLYFLKSANSYAAHQDIVRIPPSVGRVIYEGELGVVIGETCSAVSVEEARKQIFGYTCVNDVTALELLFSDPSFHQWTRAKSFDGFGVFGPVIATGLDVSALKVTTSVNDHVRQDYPISDAIFSPAELVSRISHDMTLEPGDIIACGTSLGTLPVRDGTVVDVRIDGIGTLQTTFSGAGAS